MARIHVPISLRWSDIDAYGHVNNAEMLRLLEEARIAVFWADPAGPAAPANPAAAGVGEATAAATPSAAPTISASEGELPPASARIGGGPGAQTHTLIAAQQIEYLLPVPFVRQPLDIQLWIGRFGGASIEICYEVCSPRGSDPHHVFARAATTLVLVDAATQRPTRVTADLKAAWSNFTEPRIEFRAR